MQARIEELSSSDDEGAGGGAPDPDEMDITDFSASPLVPRTMFGHANPNPSGAPQPPSAMPAGRSVPLATAASSSSASAPPPPGGRPAPFDRERVKRWQCLYPLYFDAGRTRAEGRRVGKDVAVANPLAREIVEAVGRLGLQVAFEPGACHPRDWANPGRVRVRVRGDDGAALAALEGLQGKHHLFLKVAEHLRLHPTTNLSPLRLKVPGMPPPAGPLPPPAAPRGWRLNAVLPLHSAAVTGGGVSDNLFKDMMAQMQQGGGGGLSGMPGMPQLPPEPETRKKDKKKIKG